MQIEADYFKGFFLNSFFIYKKPLGFILCLQHFPLVKCSHTRKTELKNFKSLREFYMNLIYYFYNINLLKTDLKEEKEKRKFYVHLF